jgi:hypothetical protein
MTAPICGVSALTKKRRRLVRARVRDRSLAEHQAAFARINASSFCHGGGTQGFIASFDWYVRSPDPAIRALEGLYDDQVSEAEIHAVREWRFRVSGNAHYCPHDPTCEEDAGCLRRIVVAHRARKFA